MLEWCSITLSTISSPGPMRLRPKLAATRLIASVAERVKTISSVDAALRKRRTRLARRLVGLGRGVGEIVQAAMDVGVFVLVGVHEPVEDGLRLLRRGGVVEIDERLAVRALGQDREILPDLLDVVRGGGGSHGVVHASASDGLRPLAASQARNEARKASASFSSSTRSMASAPNASSSIASASSFGMPRALK